ncbi:MAG: hypothetical protein R3209_12015, partial [Salinimicrobium sediminis]|nr:hypothetical protein [Salinimicrobium sediminis]
DANRAGSERRHQPAGRGSVFLPAQPHRRIGRGHYNVIQDSVILTSLGFNVDRRESLPVQKDIRVLDGVYVHQSIPQVLNDIKSAGEVHTLWKWFIILALFFLLTEMLILKFLK